MTRLHGRFIIAGLAAAAALAAQAQIQIITGGNADEQGPSGVSITVPGPTNNSVSGVAGATETSDFFEFVNLDKLHGTLISMDPSTYGVRLKHGSVEKPIEFALSALSRVRLAPRNAGSHSPDTADIQMSNDDLLSGKIVEMDADKLILDTWYAGKIPIKRSMLKCIYGGAKSASIVYEGPVDLSEWTMSRRSNQPAWKFKDGVLYQNGNISIGRSIANLPDMADIQFSASWQSGYPSFTFIFFNDNASQALNCYSLQISSGSIYLYRGERNNGNQRLGNVDFQRFSSGQCTGAKFEVMVDKTKKAITLLIDGEMVRQWTDPAGFAGGGKSIIFSPQPQNGMRISNIRISEWDGAVPQSIVSNSGGDTKEDLVRFVNGDKVSGKLRSIARGSMKFEAAYAVMDIPLDRVSEIRMASSGLERARRNKNDIRATFPEKGALTIQLIRIEKNMLTGSSENFGQVGMPLEAFKALDLNIYREKTPADEDDGSSF
jgi:hypothetical protein